MKITKRKGKRKKEKVKDLNFLMAVSELCPHFPQFKPPKTEPSNRAGAYFNNQIRSTHPHTHPTHTIVDLELPYTQ